MAGPITSGVIYGLEAGDRKRERDQRDQLFQMNMQREQLGLEDARRSSQQRKDLDAMRREHFFDKEDVPEDNGIGTTTRYKPKEYASEADRLQSIVDFGQKAMMSMDMSPEQVMSMSERVRQVQREGRMESVNALVRSGGDINAAKKAFNATGDEEIVGTMPTKHKDHLGERDVYVARIRNKKTGDERVDRIDPYKEAYELGGIKGIQQMMHDQETGRRTDVAERQADTAAQRASALEYATLARLGQGDRRLDQRDEENGIRREAIWARAFGLDGKPARASVFEQKRLAYLAAHEGDEEGALDYANGRKALSNADLRLAAERMANSLKDPRTGMALDAAAKKAQADTIFARLQKELQAPRNPPKPGGGGPMPVSDPKQAPKRSLEQFLR